jgi:hypothetical protein
MTAPFGLELAINTWHVSRLRGDDVSLGLPSSLLAKHSALFLVVDRAVCDSNALRIELAWADYWLSAKMFKMLMDAGLLRSVDLHGEPFVSPDFWDRLIESDIGQQALNRMHELSSEPDEGDSRALQSLDPFLLLLNRSLFLNLRLPPN